MTDDAKDTIPTPPDVPPDDVRDDTVEDDPSVDHVAPEKE